MWKHKFAGELNEKMGPKHFVYGENFLFSIFLFIIRTTQLIFTLGDTNYQNTLMRNAVEYSTYGFLIKYALFKYHLRHFVKKHA